MSKLTRNEKLVKAVMVGGVALAPVMAVGVNTQSVTAATNEEIAEVAENLALRYERLNADQEEVFDIVLANVHDYMGSFIEDTYPHRTKLIPQLQSLVKPYSPSSGKTLEQTLNDRFKNFVTNTYSYLDEEGTVDELLLYIDNVSSDLLEAASTADKDELDDFYNDLFNILTDHANNVPPGLKEIIIVPKNAGTIITEIQREVDKAFEDESGGNTGGGGTGGGGGSTPSPTPAPTPTPEEPVVDDKKGQVAATADAVVSNPQIVIDAIKAAEQISTLAVALKAGADDIAIPFTVVSALKDKNGEAIVAVSAEHATYHMPVAEIDAAAVARQLGVATSELKLVVSMEKVTNPLAGQSTYKVLSDAVDFTASLQAPDSKSVELTVFTKPVQRTILSTQTALDPVTTVGVMVGANGAITAVPTYVTEDKKNADLYRAGNSTYTLIENFKTFNDVNNGKNWAEDYIERLASKMVVNGTTATTFEPDRSISRGEFAALLSRGLGLTAQNKTVKFSDVSANQAFNKNGEIASVVEAGIVQGDKNGKFRPYDTITRDEAAIMISRAMDFIDSEYVKLEPGKKVSHFEDYRYIGGTARPHVEKVYQAGYLGGYSNGTFGPANETERAQMAKILYNFLQSIHYIN